jgi:hypothetical protein
MRFVVLMRNIVAEFLAWFGIVGGCLTLFGSFADVMPLDPWASTLIATWHAYTTEPVVAILTKIGMYSPQGAKGQADPAWIGAKTFAFFTIPLAFGLRLKVVRWSEGWRATYIALVKSLAHWLQTFAYIIYAVVAFYVTAVVLFALQSANIIPWSEHTSTMLTISVAYVIVLVAILHHQVTIDGSSRFIGTANTAFMLLAYTILAVFPRLAAKETWDEFMNSFGMFAFITMPLLILAPPRQLFQRFALLVAGLFLLVSANVATNGKAVCQKIALPLCSRS